MNRALETPFLACDKTVIRQFREYLANQDKFDFCSELDLSQSDDEVNLSIFIYIQVRKYKYSDFEVNKFHMYETPM